MIAPVIELRGVSRWYGPVLGLREVSLSIHPGVTGLLGPNGAGKSTLMKVLTGEVTPQRGEALVLGRRVPSPEVFRQLGYAPEIEGFFEELTALEWVTTLAALSGLSRTDAPVRARETLTRVGLAAAMDRRLSGYSKGMRQRARLAQALVHDPTVVLLDEPMTGLDPMARAQMSELLRDLGRQGKTVLVSSHILDEVEAITPEIVVLYQGQLLAQGDIHAIRDLIDRHPHRVSIACDRPRDLAAALATEASVTSINFASPTGLDVETRSPDACYAAIPSAALRVGVHIHALTSPDDNLAAVFRYLTLDRAVGAEGRAS